MSHTTYGLLKAIRSHTIDTPSVQTSLSTGRPNACNQCHLDKTMAWTAGRLEQWYGIGRPDLDDAESATSAGVLWALKGDAGQRALIAWSMGWAPAREAAGTDWMTPHLGQLLADPYEAVRFIAYRSLQLQSGYEDFIYDFVGPPRSREMASDQVLQIWSESLGDATAPAPELLIGTGGQLDRRKFQQLLEERDDTQLILNE